MTRVPRGMGMLPLFDPECPQELRAKPGHIPAFSSLLPYIKGGAPYQQYCVLCGVSPQAGGNGQLAY